MNTAAEIADPTRLSVDTPRPFASDVLPAWPLLVLLHGFPVVWLLGLSAFITPMAACVMLAFLIVRMRVRLVPGLLPYGSFLAWALASSVMLGGFGQALGFAHRMVELLSVGIIMMYYVNARETLNLGRVLSGFLTLWITLVVLGLSAIFVPDLRLTTPVGLVLPQSIAGNELVRELVNPRLAEVQQPWGAEEPFNRPAAPFPYTNSWGMAFVLLTPIAALTAWRTRRRAVRTVIAAGLALSIWPAAETSNRGMFLGVGIFVLVLTVRWLLRGQFRPAIGVISAVGAAFAVLSATGVVGEILKRQEVSNTTEGRGSIYRATIDRALESPFAGWATPKVDPSIGIALGTQGYIWTLVFCYGFIGCGLFLVFLGGSAIRTWQLTDPTHVVLHCLLPTVLCTIWFYGLGVIQLTVVALAAAVLLRARHDEEQPWPR